jgi:uncharacterized protein
MQLIQLTRRAGASVLPEDLNDTVIAVLLSEAPDMEALERRLVSQLNLSPADARSALYDVVQTLNGALFPPVTHLELIHTEGCNLSCSYCFEKEMLGYRRMAPEVACAAVDLLFAYSAASPQVTIVHFGGEPTLNFASIRLSTERAEASAAATGKTVDFNITSNGVLLTEAMVKYFADHSIKVLLSIDGLQASHDRYRLDKRGRGTFARVVAAMHLLKRAQKWIGAKMTVMPENASRLYDDVLGLYDVGVNQFIIGYATGVVWSREDMEVYTSELSRVHRWYVSHDRRDLKISEFDEADEGPFYGCQAGKISITVSVDGEISPCSKILALDNRSLVGKLGDIRYGLSHLKNRGDLVTCTPLRRAVLEQGIQNTFRGGCFASNHEAQGDMFVPNMQDHMFSVLERSKCAGCSSHR